MRVVGLVLGFTWAGLLMGAPVTDERSEERERMVATQIEARGVSDPRVLATMRRIPRHRFIPERNRDRAYEDRALSIAEGQTISQPFMVAVMTQFLEPQPGDRVLEIGTGSGYQAAVLSDLVDHVYSIEIVPELAESARQILDEMEIENVTVITGDGYKGLPEQAPFDGIIVTAAPGEVPQALVDQLGVGARMVIPVGRFDQKLRVFERTEDGVSDTTHFGVRFVPMVRGSEKSD